MSQSTTTTTTRGANRKRVQEEPEQTPDVLDAEIIKEILKEVRNSKVLLRQVQDELGNVKDDVQVIGADNRALSTRVGEIADAAVIDREDQDLNTLSVEEKKKISKICEELWWVQKEDVKAALGLAIKNTHSFQNRAKFRIAVRRGLQWFCNKRSNFKAACELKSPGFFLNNPPTFSDDEMESFTKHLLNNKRKHTESDILYVKKVLTNYYIPQPQQQQ